MSSSGRYSSADLEVEQSGEEEVPVKIVQARKPASTLVSNRDSSAIDGNGRLEGADWLRTNLHNNWENVPHSREGVNSPGIESSFRSFTQKSAFRSIESPFKDVSSANKKGFSATPGPALKAGDSHSNRGSDTLHTPSRNITNGMTTPTQYNMFKSDDGWSNVRKAAGNLSDMNSSPVPAYMSPLMHSMVNQIVDQNSPHSPLRSAVKAGDNDDDDDDDLLNEPAVRGELPADPDLDIRNVARDLDAVRFQGSLSSSTSTVLGSTFGQHSRTPSGGSYQTASLKESSVFSNDTRFADYNPASSASWPAGLDTSLAEGSKQQPSTQSYDYSREAHYAQQYRDGYSQQYSAKPSRALYNTTQDYQSRQQYERPHSYQEARPTAHLYPTSNPQQMYQNWVREDSRAHAGQRGFPQDAPDSRHQAYRAQDHVDDFGTVVSQLSEGFVNTRHSGGALPRYAQQRPPLQRGQFSASWSGHQHSMSGDHYLDSGTAMRPPQQTSYEPALPSGPSGGRVSGRGHRLGRSDGSIDTRFGAGRAHDDRQQRLSFDYSGSSIRSSNTSLGGSHSVHSSYDSETSHNGNQRLFRGGHDPLFSHPSKGPLGKVGNSVNTSVVRVASEASKQSLNRPDVVESPRSKQAYREFYREFRLREKICVDAAKAHADETLKTAPENCKWRIYLELADLAKRHDQIPEVCNSDLVIE
jgi:hypothetical protein